MKQLYYGNVYEDGGYKILAQSEGIDEWTTGYMKRLAEISDPSDNDVYGMLPCGEGMVYLKAFMVAPKLEKGENRPTVFSHQYYISTREKNDLEKILEKFIVEVKFASGYANEYNVSEIPLPHMCSGAVRFNTNSDIVTAVKNVIEKKGHLLIYSRYMNADKALKIASGIAGNLSSDERGKFSFVAGDFKNRSVYDSAMLIICSYKQFNKLKVYYNQNCIYYNADTKEITDTDAPIDVNNTFEGDSIAADRLQDISKKAANDYDNVTNGDQHNSGRTPKPGKNARLNLLTVAAALILGIAAGTALGYFLWGRNITDNEIVQETASSSEAMQAQPTDNGTFDMSMTADGKLEGEWTSLNGNTMRITIDSDETGQVCYHIEISGGEHEGTYEIGSDKKNDADSGERVTVPTLSEVTKFFEYKYNNYDGSEQIECSGDDNSQPEVFIRKEMS